MNSMFANKSSQLSSLMICWLPLSQQNPQRTNPDQSFRLRPFPYAKIPLVRLKTTHAQYPVPTTRFIVHHYERIFNVKN